MTTYSASILDLEFSSVTTDSSPYSFIWFFEPPYVPPTPPVQPPKVPLPPGIMFPEEAYNALQEMVSVFLGYRPTAGELEEFPFQIYNFIIKSLRLQDALRGSAKYVLKRFLMGPQEIWVRIHQRTGDIYTLYDPEAIDAEYLPGLRKLVGFGDDLIDVVAEASEIELRRIIAGAVNFWRQRWLDSGVVAAIRLVTGNRYKVRDYFDFRFIVGETMIMEDLENTDPNMIHVNTLNRFQQGTDGVTRYSGNPLWFYSASASFRLDDAGGYLVVTNTDHSDDIYRILDVVDSHTLKLDPFMVAPSESNATWFTAFPYDEFLTEIRIVDEKTGEGELNRALLTKLLKLQRPNSERFNVVYVDFLDQFTTPYDSGQWIEQVIPSGGLNTFTVDEGILTLEDNGVIGGLLANRPTSSDWKRYQWRNKVALGSAIGTFQLEFLYVDNLNHFFLEVDYQGFGTGTVQLFKRVAGVDTALTAAIPFPDLNPETFWTYSIELFDIPVSQLNVKLLIDRNLIADITTPSTWSAGNIGFRMENGTKIWVSETELWQYPLEIDRVGPNP